MVVDRCIADLFWEGSPPRCAFISFQSRIAIFQQTSAQGNSFIVKALACGSSVRTKLIPLLSEGEEGPRPGSVVDPSFGPFGWARKGVP